MRVVIGLMVAWLLTACTATGPRLDTAWGPAQQIATAASGAAPVFVVFEAATSAERVLFAWTGGDEAETRHYAADLSATDQPNPAPTILALRAFFPRDYAALPAAADRAHVLWVDRTPVDDRPRLLSGLITPQLIAETGPVPLSGADAGHYDAVPLAEGRMRLVWSEGQAGRRILFTRVIDGRGRPGFSTSLPITGDYPALAAAADGSLELFWLTDTAVWRAALADDDLGAAVRVTQSVIVRPGSTLRAFTVSRDETHTYLFWQVVAADGTPAAYYSTAPHGATAFPLPQPLTVAVQPETTQTGYNSGTVQAATRGETDAEAIRWLRALPGQNAVVPAVVTSGAHLGMLYFQAGDIIGYQQITALPTPLIERPYLTTDRDRTLYVTWAQPDPLNPAALYFVSSRPRQ